MRQYKVVQRASLKFSNTQYGKEWGCPNIKNTIVFTQSTQKYRIYSKYPDR